MKSKNNVYKSGAEQYISRKLLSEIEDNVKEIDSLEHLLRLYPQLRSDSEYAGIREDKNHYILIKSNIGRGKERRGLFFEKVRKNGTIKYVCIGPSTGNSVYYNDNKADT